MQQTSVVSNHTPSLFFYMDSVKMMSKEETVRTVAKRLNTIVVDTLADIHKANITISITSALTV